MVALFAPWTLALVRRWRLSELMQLEPGVRSWILGSGSFSLAGLACFMLVPASETRYLTPLAVPIGILCGLVLAHRNDEDLGIGRWVAAAVALVLLVASPVMVATGELEIPMSHGLLLSLTGALMLVVTWRLPRWTFPSMGRPASLFSVLALGLCAVHILAIVPHRTSSRSMQAAATVFQPHLPEHGELWAGPVRAGYEHSSLNYYLPIPIRTFPLDQPPPPGSRVLLFADEVPGFEDPPMPYRILQETTRRGVRLAIVEVIDSSSRMAGSGPTQSASQAPGDLHLNAASQPAGR